MMDRGTQQTQQPSAESHTKHVFCLNFGRADAPRLVSVFGPHYSPSHTHAESVDTKRTAVVVHTYLMMFEERAGQPFRRLP